MIIKKYKLVFNGDIADGNEIASVRNNLRLLFKITEPDVERLFTNTPATIKADLTYETAIKYQAIFEKTGGRCSVKPMEFTEDSLSDDAIGAGENEADNLIRCPKCLFEQSRATICIKCGIVMDRFSEHQGEINPDRIDNEARNDEIYPESLGIKKDIFSIGYLKANLKYLTVALLVIGAGVFGISRYWLHDSSTGTGVSQVSAPRIHPLWLKSFAKQNRIVSVNLTRDGGYSVAGKAVSMLRLDTVILKLDSGGNIQWQQAFESNGANGFQAVVQTSDNGYFATGVTKEAGKGSLSKDVKGFLIKFSPQGTVQWQKTVSGVVYKTIAQAPSGDIFLIGESTVTGNSDFPFLIAKLGSDGQCKWQKNYGKDKWRVIRQTSDGGCVVIGADALVMKIDSSGTVQWQHEFPGELNAVEEMADEGFVLAGSIKHNSNESKVTGKDNAFYRFKTLFGGTETTQARLLKLNRNGIVQWHKRYSGNSFSFNSLYKTKDGSFVVSGNTENNDVVDKDLWLMSLAEDGSINWQKAFEKPYREIAYGLQPLADGGYLVIGNSINFGGKAVRSFIGKTDSSGELPGCKSQPVNSSNSVAENAILPPCRPVPANVRDVLPDFNSLQLPNSDLQIKVATIFPPEPKLEVTSSAIKFGHIGPVVKDYLSKDVMRLENIGGADLTITKMKITAKDDRSIIARIWALITLQTGPSFSLYHDCTTIKPDSLCAFRVDFKSGIPGDNKAILTIFSNDPDTPVLRVPIIATVAD